jgi:hypothetical protein
MTDTLRDRLGALDLDNRIEACRKLRNAAYRRSTMHEACELNGKLLAYTKVRDELEAALAAQPAPAVMGEELREIATACNVSTTDSEGNSLDTEELKAKIISSNRAAWNEYNRE